MVQEIELREWRDGWMDSRGLLTGFNLTPDNLGIGQANDDYDVLRLKQKKLTCLSTNLKYTDLKI